MLVSVKELPIPVLVNVKPAAELVLVSVKREEPAELYYFTPRQLHFRPVLGVLKLPNLIYIRMGLLRSPRDIYNPLKGVEYICSSGTVTPAFSYYFWEELKNDLTRPEYG